MLRVESDKSDWFWSQSNVFTKPFKTRMSLDLARGPDFQRMTKGIPRDEVVSLFSSPEAALFLVSIKTTSGKVQFSDLAQSNRFVLSDLTLSMRRVTGSP